MTHKTVEFAVHALPPGPKAPRIVQAISYIRDPYGFMGQCHRRYGDSFTLRLPGRPPTIITTEQEAIHEFSTAGYDGSHRYAEEFRYLIGDASIVLQQDEPHKTLRKLMTPPFHGERMRMYGHDMLNIVDAHIGRWQEGKSYLLHKELKQMTLRVILRCTFGIDNEQRLDRLMALYLKYIDIMTRPWVYGLAMLMTARKMYSFLRNRMGGRRWPEAAVLLTDIEAILFDEIASCRRLSETDLAARTDILAMLVTARFDDGSSFSDDDLRDHLFTMLFAGYETTATSMAWAIYCLLTHPDALIRVQTEIRTIMREGFELERTKELSYLNATINESMRLYPIAVHLARLLKTPMQLVNHTLPAGVIVAPCMYLVHRDRRLWEDPDTFRPERFIEAKPPVRQFFPFGFSVWRCLGAPFAEYQMRVVLSRIMSQVEFRLLEPKIRPVQRGPTVAPSHGLPVQILCKQ